MQNITGMQGQRIRSLEELNGRNDPEAIKLAAREMESLFAYEMIKAMRQTSGQSDKGGLGKDTYMSMFDMELSKIIAERGLGLQDLFIRQLTAAAAKANPSAAKEVDLSAEIKTMLPLNKSASISSGFGPRQDPFTGEEKFHHGIDIPAPAGAEIHPVKSGTVLFSGEQGGYGNVVIIDHGEGLSTTYAHNQENKVKAGDSVDSQSVIALVGSTGRSTGPHVHLEVQFQGKKVPPQTLLAKR